MDTFSGQETLSKVFRLKWGLLLKECFNLRVGNFSVGAWCEGKPSGNHKIGLPSKLSGIQKAYQVP